MNTGELLSALCVQFPRQELYYLESQGMIHPRKRRIGRTNRREWPDEIVPLLERYWTFREEGFPPRVAWEKASQSNSDVKEK